MTRPSDYTEEELEQMTRKHLLEVCKAWALFYSMDVDCLSPKTASKDFLIDTILENQEPKGGSE